MDALAGYESEGDSKMSGDHTANYDSVEMDISEDSDAEQQGRSSSARTGRHHSSALAATAAATAAAGSSAYSLDVDYRIPPTASTSSLPTGGALPSTAERRDSFPASTSSDDRGQKDAAGTSADQDLRRDLSRDRREGESRERGRGDSERERRRSDSRERDRGDAERERRRSDSRERGRGDSERERRRSGEKDRREEFSRRGSDSHDSDKASSRDGERRRRDSDRDKHRDSDRHRTSDSDRDRRDGDRDRRDDRRRDDRRDADRGRKADSRDRRDVERRTDRRADRRDGRDRRDRGRRGGRDRRDRDRRDRRSRERDRRDRRSRSRSRDRDRRSKRRSRSRSRTPDRKRRDSSDDEGRPRVTPGVPVIPPPKGGPSMLNPFPYYNPTVPPPAQPLPPGPDKDKVRERLEKLKKQGNLAIYQQIMSGLPQPPSPAQVGTPLPSYLNPTPMNTFKFLDQERKKKLLWGNKKAEAEQQAAEPSASSTATAGVWKTAAFEQDKDGKMATKFLKLMGVKNAEEVASKNTEATETVEKQKKMFDDMEHQYEQGRVNTHMQKGYGLGYTTQYLQPKS